MATPLQYAGRSRWRAPYENTELVITLKYAAMMPMLSESEGGGRLLEYWLKLNESRH